MKALLISAVSSWRWLTARHVDIYTRHVCVMSLWWRRETCFIMKSRRFMCSFSEYTVKRMDCIRAFDINIRCVWQTMQGLVLLSTSELWGARSARAHTHSGISTCKRPHLFSFNVLFPKMFIFCNVALSYFLPAVFLWAACVLFRFVLYIINAFISLNFFLFDLI